MRSIAFTVIVGAFAAITSMNTFGGSVDTPSASGTNFNSIASSPEMAKLKSLVDEAYLAKSNDEGKILKWPVLGNLLYDDPSFQNTLWSVIQLYGVHSPVPGMGDAKSICRTVAEVMDGILDQASQSNGNRSVDTQMLKHSLKNDYAGMQKFLDDYKIYAHELPAKKIQLAQARIASESSAAIEKVKEDQRLAEQRAQLEQQSAENARKLRDEKLKLELAEAERAKIKRQEELDELKLQQERKEQQEEDHKKKIKSGELPIVTQSDAVDYYDAKSGMYLLSAPLVKADGAYYVFAGMLYKANDNGYIGSTGGKDSRYFILKNTDSTKVVGDLRVGYSFTAVGKYSGNTEVPLVLGNSQTAPVFEAAYIFGH